MVFFPNAKINLGLSVTEIRPDGYHNIETIMYPLPVVDALEMVEAPDDRFRFSQSGIEISGPQSDNLVFKAWNLLRNDFNLPGVQVHLHKAIPMGAGAGGGSADGAFMIRLINSFFGLGLSIETMQEYAAKLGMDCPFFIENVPAYANERGDKLSPIDLDLSGYYLAFVHPGIHISTREAYAGVSPSKPKLDLREIVNQPVKEWKLLLKNDFEHAIFIQHPEIKAIREELYNHGALYASMTGSGSAVYGIFENSPGLKQNFNPYYYTECLL